MDNSITVHQTKDGGRKADICSLLEAIKKKEISDVELNESDFFGDTMLTNICKHGTSGQPFLIELVGTILECGVVDVNHENHVGFRAIHYACQNINPPLVKLLKYYGAKTDVATHDGLSPASFCHDNISWCNNSLNRQTDKQKGVQIYNCNYCLALMNNE